MAFSKILRCSDLCSGLVLTWQFSLEKWMFQHVPTQNGSLLRRFPCDPLCLSTVAAKKSSQSWLVDLIGQIVHRTPPTSMWMGHGYLRPTDRDCVGAEHRRTPAGALRRKRQMAGWVVVPVFNDLRHVSTRRKGVQRLLGMRNVSTREKGCVTPNTCETEGSEANGR